MCLWYDVAMLGLNSSWFWIQAKVVSSQVINASSNILIYTFVGNSFREQFLKIFHFKTLFCNLFQRWRPGKLKAVDWSLFAGKTRKKISSWARRWRKSRLLNKYSDVSTKNTGLVFLGVRKYTYDNYWWEAKKKYGLSCNNPFVQQSKFGPCATK